MRGLSAAACRRVAVLFAAVAFMPACDDDAGIVRLEPELWTYDPAVAPDLRPMEGLAVLDFGEVPVGATAERLLGLRNRGLSGLSICVQPGTACSDLTAFVPDTAVFAVEFGDVDDDTGVFTVTENSDREVPIRFVPTVNGSTETELRIVHNGAGRETRIRITGIGVSPQVDVSTTELDFGAVTVNQRRALAVTMTNRTNFAQPIRAEPFAQGAVIFGYTDPQGRDLAPDERLNIELPAAASADFLVWFQPPEEGDHANSMTLRYCPTCEHTIAVRGVGIKPLFSLEPTALSFGDVEEGQRPMRTFDIVNLGTVDLEVRTIGLERGTSDKFSTEVADATPLPLSLPPNARSTVNVFYDARAPGVDGGRIEVTTNAWEDTDGMTSAATAYVSVDGTTLGPDINPFPSPVLFGVVAIETQKSRILALQNSGTLPLQITNVQLTGSSEIGFAAPPPVPATVQPGASLDIPVVYAPTDAGPDEATITVVSNDRDEGTVTIEASGVGGVPTTCSVSVAPTQVTFGLVERGRQAILPVEIRNAGAQPCAVSNFALSGDTEFSLTDGVRPQVTIAPGAIHRVSVAYQPVAYGDHTTDLTFDSDDPAQGAVRVPISGSSAQSSILVVPSSLDFAVVPVTCWSPQRTVTIYNTGATSVTLQNIYLDPSTTPEFELRPVSTPLSLRGGGSTVLQMYYRPTDIGQDTGLLFIDHTAAAVPVAVPLAGDGRISPTVTDTFQQVAAPQVDVLFIVDDSGSMAEEQLNLGANLSAFLTVAIQQGIDYHIAVTTTDTSASGERGRFVPLVGDPSARIITPQTPNPSMAFRTNTNVGVLGSGTERGLEAVYLALSDPLINTHNGGFLRSSAALAVIFVSDEPDSSSRPVSFYENFLRNIKGFQNTSMFSASAVVGITNPRCNSPDGRADYAPRYIEVARNSGGVVESICGANWGRALGNIGRNSFGFRRQFTLSSQPVVQTIAVEVDGAPLPRVDANNTTNWTFDSGSNTLNFMDVAVPAAGSTVNVTYTVACLSGP